MPELTVTSPYVHSRVVSNTCTMGNPLPESRPQPHARVDFIPQSGTLDLTSGMFEVQINDEQSSA
jgi:hypothetical protein